VVGLRRNRTSVCANASRSHDMSAHDPTYPHRCFSVHLNLQRHQQVGSQLHPPLPSSEGCGRLIVNQRGTWGVEKREGGPRRWEAQAVRHENGQRQMSLPVFSHSLFLRLPLTPVTPRLPPPPPPLHPNMSRRWFFSLLSTCHPPPPPPSHPIASRRWFFASF
jgi:hypothetical protein